MSNQTQIERYKKLISFLDENFKEDLNIKKIEAVCHYSYRNINRIFAAIHQETIGKYIKRLRLEKAAQFLKYSKMSISDIAYAVGFEDRSVFSKMFKKRYNSSPSVYRESDEALIKTKQQSITEFVTYKSPKLEFEIVYLPDFYYVFLENRGSYQDISSIEKTGNEIFQYTLDKDILNEQSLFMTEIIDDSTISDSIHLRYHLGFILEKPLQFEPEGLVRIKKHKRQKYVKFTHLGSHASCIDFYDDIYLFWLTEVELELKDLPIIEIYPEYHTDQQVDAILTEIYIPVE